MADKLTHLILEALTRGAAEPGGLPLYASKADAGLFPNTAVAKPAAQKCLADDLVRVAAPDPKGKRDLYALSEKGWEFLLAAVNPKQVLEDFVRVLEMRQGEVGELLATARRMADSLQGLKDAVARVLPGVTAARVERPTPPGPPSLKGRGEEIEDPSPNPLSQGERGLAPPSLRGKGVGGLGSFSPLPFREGGPGGVGLLSATELAPAVLAHLAGRAGATDCTLPELYRALTGLSPAPSIGEFHDCLRTLHADGALALHSWTGPLYALPEPQFALLIGHGIAYYASLRSQDSGFRIQDSDRTRF